MKNQYIYHLVPKYIYEKSINRLGNYNCRGFENSNYIHSTLDLKKLKEIADIIFTKTQNHKDSGKFFEPPKIKFLMLKIKKDKIRARMTSDNDICYHIYGSIPKDAYKIKKVRRDKKGRFIFDFK